MTDELEDVGGFLELHLAETNGQRPFDTDFWDARPAFQHIRKFAYSRMCSPWAVLGMSMLHTLHWVPPWVWLPPIVGSIGSLNSFVALVGPSGGGKGAAEACAIAAFDMHHLRINPVAVGSGEGIVHQYAHWEGRGAQGSCVQDRNEVLFTVSEVDQLGALKMRNGSTLLSQLRMAWTGEALGFAYSNTEKRVMLERHKYRFGLTIGVQPLRAALLLDDVDAGTPQRMLWLPVEDKGITANVPASPKPMYLDSTRGVWPSRHELYVPEEASQQIREARAAQMRGEREALNGHALFARLKAAYAVALLDDRREMSLEDWELAGTIMQKSDQTRAMVQRELKRKEDQVEKAKALSAGRTEVIKGDMVEEAQVAKTCQAIMRKLTRDWMRGSEVRKWLSGKNREWFEAAIEALRLTGDIEVQEVHGTAQPGIQVRRAK